MISMIVNKLTSFSKLTTTMHSFKLHTFLCRRNHMHRPNLMKLSFD